MTKRATLPFLVTAISGLVLAVVLTASGSAATVGATAPSSKAPAAASAKAGSAGAKTIARNAQGRMTSKIVGETNRGQKVSGTFTPLSFGQDAEGQLTVEGLIQGVTKKGGKPTTFSVVRTLSVASLNGVSPTASSGGGDFAPAASAPINCDILNLVLGPLDLDLLGLQIHLDRVVLNIIAAAGAGNLLGNLLCAVAGLLDGGLAGLLQNLIDLLNQILGNLRLGG